MTDKINVAGIENESIVDGEGVRLTVFVQGCLRHCQGCHNPSTWDINKKALLLSADEIMSQYNENPLLSGITFSGGEPFLQADKLIELADKVHEAGGTVWCYTGYTLEDLRVSEEFSGLLNRIDVLIDGPYIESERDLTLEFRGSRNQKVWKNVKGVWTRDDSYR